MHYIGSTDISTSRQLVWAALIDPHQMSACMPGLVHWHEVQANKVFELHIAWGSPRSPQINLPLRITWRRLEPPHLMVVRGETAVNQLTIHVAGTITLTRKTKNITTLAFDADVTTPNRMLDRLVHTAVPPTIAQFFKCLKQILANS